MEAWMVVVIVAAAAIVVGAVVWAVWRKRRTSSLRQTFGPEYDRTLERAGSRRDAEADMMERRRRRERLEIRPLTPAARQRYVESWRALQARFVDEPAQAVQEAEALVTQVMKERGYPMEDFDRRAADISVDHPNLVEEYRAAHEAAMMAGSGQASTEQLRQAVVHFRSLFDQLLGPGTADRVAEAG